MFFEVNFHAKHNPFKHHLCYISMQVYKRMIISGALSLLAVSFTLFSKVVPCRVFPSPLGSVPFWSYCTLNSNDLIKLYPSKVLYLGQFETISTPIISIFLGIFILIFLFLGWMFKSKKH